MKAIVTVLGKDRVGIIASVCAMLSACGVNILDISQTVMQGYFTMIMLVDVSGSSKPFADMVSELSEMGKASELEIRMQREDIFNAMHRI